MSVLGDIIECVSSWTIEIECEFQVKVSIWWERIIENK